MTSIQKNQYQEIRMEVANVDGFEGISVRIYSSVKGEFVPTRKGIWFRLDLLPDFLEMVDAFIETWLDDAPSTDEVVEGQQVIASMQ